MLTLLFNGTSFDDFVLDQPHRLIAHGGGGNDLLIGSPKGDLLFGDGGADCLSGWAGNDEIHGGGGGDIIAAGAGRDRVHGDGGNDFINGDGGGDIVDGGAGSDILWGGYGADHVSGGRGNDLLLGGSAAAFPAQSLQLLFFNWDGLNDQPGLCMTVSDPGVLAPFDTSRDVLDGGEGNDRLDGGFGKDLLTGGAGADRFLFTTTPGVFNIDRITDFRPGVDKIGLADLVFTTLGAQVTPDEFRLGGAAKDGNDHVLYKQSTGELLYDADGKGGAAAQTFAILVNHAHLTSHDFLIV